MIGLIVSLFKILLSGVLGGLIGYEREKEDKPAGLRTVMLVAVGSTAFAIASIELGHMTEMADPGRVASYVVAGIGFLGAGAIIRGQGGIHGLTTAAAIWATAAVGILVGIGLIIEAIFLTGLVYYVLRYLPSVLEEDRIGKKKSDDE